MVQPKHSRDTTDVVDVIDAVETPTPPTADAKPATGLLGKAQDWWQRNGGTLETGARDAVQDAKVAALRAGDRAKAYVQKEPVKAVAIAAAAGAVLTVLMSARGKAKKGARADE